MEVILLQDVEKLGLRGEVVDVARGYARNYLLPRRLAENATPARVAEIRRVEAERAKHEARTAEQAQEIAETLGKTVLRFEVKAGPTGSLFGSVTPSDVADEIWRARKIRVDRRKIAIDPLKRIGRFSVPIELFQDVHVEVKTLVVPEGGELPPEEELAALEAAEAAEAAAAAAEAEAEHVEAETAITEVLTEEVADEAEDVGVTTSKSDPDARCTRRIRRAVRRRLLPDTRAIRAALALTAAVRPRSRSPAARRRPPAAPVKPRVTVIGDSVMASFDYVPAARRYLGKGLDLRSDASVCRRLVAASCAFQGATPATALELIASTGPRARPGRRDQRRLQRLDRRVRRRPRDAGAARSRASRTVIWVTLREAATSNYAGSNARIRSAGAALEEPRRRRLERVQPQGSRGSGRTACTSRRREPWASRACCARSSSRRSLAIREAVPQACR